MIDTGSGRDSDNAGETLTIDDALDGAFDAFDEKQFSEIDQGSDELDDKDEEDGAEDAADLEASDDDEQPERDPASEAPQHWPADRRQAFAEASPKIRSAWLAQAKDLEAGFTRKSQELSDQAKVGSAIREIFTPQHRALMAQAGGDELSTIKGLVQLSDFARSNPAEYVKWFAGQTGLDLSAVTGQPAAKAEDDFSDLFADPRVDKLTGELNQLQQIIRAQQAQQAEQVTRTSLSTVEQFEQATGDDGSPLYPHFRHVAQTMGRLMQSVPELMQLPDGPEKLQLAYDRAVWLNPELRQQMIDAEVSAKTAREQAAREAKRARQASTPRASLGTGSQQRKPVGLDAILDDVLSNSGL